MLKFSYLFVLMAYGLTYSNGVQSKDPKQIYKSIQPSVYQMMVYKRSPSNKVILPIGRGSAVAISNNLLLTSCHLIEKSDYIIAKNAKEEYRSILVDGDLKKDLCVLYVRGNLNPIAIRPSDQVEVGETVYSYTNAGTANEFIQAMVSGIVKHPNMGTLIKFNANSPGARGAGLFDNQGRLLGITMGNVDNLSYASSLDWVKTNLPYLQQAKDQNIDANIRHASNDKAEQPKNQTDIHLLGSYGKDAVSLYKTDNTCFIKVPGRSELNKTISSMYWFPQRPGSLFFYPNSIPVDKVYAKYKLVQTSKKEDFKIFQAKDYLLQDDKKLHLRYAMLKSNHSVMVHFLPLDFSPLEWFSKADYFKTKFILSNQLFYLTVTFGLDGFEEAYKHYLKDCKTQ